MPAERFVPIVELGSCARRPGQLVACDAGRAATWAEFTTMWQARAAQLADRKERRYLLATEDAFEFAADWYALMVSGATAVVPPNNQAGTLAAAAQWCEASLGAAVPGRPSLERASAGALPVLRPRFEEARIELYTSGSSGEPKRIDKTLPMLADEVAMLESLWGGSASGATVLGTVPHHHIYGLLFRVLWPLAAGRPFGMRALPDPIELEMAMNQEARVVLISTPAHLGRLPDLVDLGPWKEKLARVFSSGGPLPESAAAHLRAVLGEAPTEVLGSTETGGIAWRVRDGSSDADAWRPLPGVVIAIEQDQSLAVTSPYAGVCSQTTGDAAAWLGDGRFRLLGRQDRILKTAGKRLSLPEMEERLASHPWIAEVAVAALPGRDDRVGALLVLSAQGRQALVNQGKRALVQQWRELLAQYFDAVLLPRRWRLLGALPRDERGKLPAARLAAALSGKDDECAS